ncbi:unnamed protein product [Camellia sinensis]
MMIISIPMPPSSDDNVESPHGFQGPEPRGSQATQILSMLLFGGFVKKFLKEQRTALEKYKIGLSVVVIRSFRDEI